MKKPSLLSLAFAGLISAASAQNCTEAKFPFSNSLDDVSGKGVSLTLNGNSGSATDRNGSPNGAYSFDGSTSLKSGSINTSAWTGMAISLWVKPSSATPAKATLLQFAGNACWVSGFTTGKVVAGMDGTLGNNAASNESTSKINSNEWAHLVFSNDGTTTKIYVNGELENSYSESLYTTSSDILVIGGQKNDQWYFNGLLDDIQLFSCALSDNEVKTLYEPETPTDCNNSKYDFTNSLNDLSDKGLNLTVNGNSKWAADRFGNANSAFSFDGTTNLKSAKINTLGWKGMTASLWVKTATTTPPKATLIQFAGNACWISAFASGKVIAGMDGTLNDNNSGSQESSTGINTGQWAHVAFSNDGTKTRVYINGNIASTYDETLFTSDTCTLVIGGQQNDLWPFEGLIDEVRLFSCKLSDDEIKDLYEDMSTGIENTKNSAGAFRIYPNPVHSSSQIQINLNEPAATGSSLSITDMQGRVIVTTPIQPGQQSLSVNVPYLASGIYMVRITTPDGIATQKLAVE